MMDAPRWCEEFDLVEGNTLRLPSRARWLVHAATAQQVVAVVDESRARNLELWVLGEGSNVVLPPRLETVVLQSIDERIEADAGRHDCVDVRVGAGVHWDRLVHWAAERGLWGIENLAYIPGSAGAAPVQNIGAYGQELAGTCLRVEAVERSSGRIQTLERDECGFGYRDSRFRREPTGWVITALELRLSRAGCPVLDYPGVAATLAELNLVGDVPMDMVRAITMLRRRKLPDPQSLPNAGSFFKNPVVSEAEFRRLHADHPELPGTVVPEGVKLSAAWMIDRCGWRGLRRGGVGVAPSHALVLVHYGGADGSELLALADDIRTSVRQRFGVELEQEPLVPQSR